MKCISLMKINLNFLMMVLYFGSLIEENKKLQLELISVCDLFIGQISGIFHIAN